MPRTSTNWAVNDQITATRLQQTNADLDDIYTLGPDRGRVQRAASGTALKIDIAAFAYLVGSTKGQYAGGVNITVTNTATNYVEIDSTGTIQINTSAWTATYARLGTVTCAGGVVTALSIWKADVVGGQLGVSILENVSTLSGNVTLLSTDKLFQYLDPNGADRTVTLDTANMSEGSQFYVKNAGTANLLTIKQASTAVAYLDYGYSMLFVYDGSNWKPWFDPANTGAAFFGDGSDGTYTLDGSQAAVSGLFSKSSNNYTLLRDANFQALTITSPGTLDLAQFRLFVKGTLNGNGSIAGTGPSGGNAGNASGTTGGSAGAAAAAYPAGYFPAATIGVIGVAGGAGRATGGGAGAGSVTGTAGTSVTSSSFTSGGSGANGGAGGRGGDGNSPTGDNGGAAGPGGTGGTATTASSSTRNAVALTMGLVFPTGTATTIKGGGGGASGGGGAGGGAGPPNGSPTVAGGGGGGSGGSGSNGPHTLVAANIIGGSFTIASTGGVGGNGGNGANGTGPTGGGGGGGGGAAGGTGGWTVLVYHIKAGWTGSLSSPGGAGGTKGTKGTSGGSAVGTGPDDGTNGPTGATGYTLQFQI